MYSWHLPGTELVMAFFDNWWEAVTGYLWWLLFRTSSVTCSWPWSIWSPASDSLIYLISLKINVIGQSQTLLLTTKYPYTVSRPAREMRSGQYCAWDMLGNVRIRSIGKRFNLSQSHGFTNLPVVWSSWETFSPTSPKWAGLASKRF